MLSKGKHGAHLLVFNELRQMKSPVMCRSEAVSDICLKCERRFSKEWDLVSFPRRAFQRSSINKNIALLLESLPSSLSDLELPVARVCGKVHPKVQGKGLRFRSVRDTLLTSRSRYSTRSCVRSLSLPGVLVALHSGLDGALHVEERERSGQFLYPVPDSAWRPIGNRLPRSQLPLPVYHRRPGQWCGWLRSFSDLWSTDQTISYLLPSLIALNGCLSDHVACGNKANLAFLCRVKTFSWLFLKCQMIYKLHREILHMQLGIEGGKTLPSSQTGWFLIRLMWNGTKSIFNSHSYHVSFPYQHYSSGRYGSLFPPKNAKKKG